MSFGEEEEEAVPEAYLQSRCLRGFQAVEGCECEGDVGRGIFLFDPWMDTWYTDIDTYHYLIWWHGFDIRLPQVLKFKVSK